MTSLTSVIGFIFFVGSFLHCSEAADRLTKKKVNPEIESDYERNCNENQLNKHSKKILFYLHFYYFNLL